MFWEPLIIGLITGLAIGRVWGWNAHVNALRKAMMEDDE